MSSNSPNGHNGFHNEINDREKLKIEFRKHPNSTPKEACKVVGILWGATLKERERRSNWARQIKHEVHQEPEIIAKLGGEQVAVDSGWSDYVDVHARPYRMTLNQSWIERFKGLKRGQYPHAHKMLRFNDSLFSFGFQIQESTGTLVFFPKGGLKSEGKAWTRFEGYLVDCGFSAEELYWIVDELKSDGGEEHVAFSVPGVRKFKFEDDGVKVVGEAPPKATPFGGGVIEVTSKTSKKVKEQKDRIDEIHESLELMRRGSLDFNSRMVNLENLQVRLTASVESLVSELRLARKSRWKFW